MESMHNTYVMFLAIAAVVQFLCISALSRTRATEAQKYIVSALCVTLIYTIGCLLHYAGGSINSKIVGLKIQFVTMFFLVFSLYGTFRMVYNEIMRKSNGVILMILAVLGNIPVLFASENGMGPLGWFFEKKELVEINGTTFIDVGFGTSQKLYFFFTALLLIMELGVFIKSYVIGVKHNYKIQHCFFLTAFIAEVLILLDMLLEWYKKGVPVVPVALTVGSIVATVLYMLKKVTNLYDISRSEAMNSMSDPLFIIDNRFYVRYANKAAKVLFPEYKKLNDNSYLKLKTCAELQNIITPPIHETLEDEGLVKIGRQIYEPELKRLGENRMLLGYIITLNDVTEHRTLNNVLEAQNDKLSVALKSAKNRVIADRNKMISGAMQFIRERDPKTAEHMRRTSNYAFIIARELRRLGFYSDVLTDSYMETLGLVAPLHDIGKFMLPVELYNKTDLTEEEKNTVHSHVMFGMQMVDRMIVNNRDDLFYRLAYEVTLYHHERWDGTGYPKGLVEEEIPLSARIIAVSDVFDSLSAPQNSKYAYSFDEACRVVENYSNNRFDPDIVEAFKSAKEKLRELYEQMF